MQRDRLNKRLYRLIPLILLAVAVVLALPVASPPVMGDAGDPPHIEVNKSVSPDPVPMDGVVTVTLTITGAGEPAGVRTPLDVILIIDRSTSMLSDGKLADAKVAAKAFVDTLDSSIDHVGLVSYGTTATLNIGLTNSFSAVKSAIDALVAPVFPVQLTNIADAINLANNELITNGRPQSPPSNAVWVEILLTDGVPNRCTGCSCSGVDFCEQAAQRSRDRALEGHNAGITLYTIGLGSDVVTEFLDDKPAGEHTSYLYDGLAFIGGGHYYFAPTGAQLQAIFDEISQQISNLAGRDIQVIDVLPPGVNYVDGTAVPAPDSNNGSLTWNVGLTSIGDTVTITFDVTFDSSGHQLVESLDSKVVYTDYLGNHQEVLFPETYVTVSSPIEISSVALYDSTRATPTTAMDPQTEYAIKVSVTDNSTLTDLNWVKVTLYYDADGIYNVADVPTSGHFQTAAILQWTAGPSWTMDAGTSTTWQLVTASCVQPVLSSTSGDFWFHFKPGKVATETVSPAKWHIYAEANDSSSTPNSHQENREMNWYGEITINTPSIIWGTIAPGTDFGDSTKQTGISVTYVANGAYKKQVAASTPWAGNPSGSSTLNTAGTPGANEFSLKADDTATLGSAGLVSASPGYITIDATGTQTDESGDTVTTNTLWLKLGSPFVDAIYSGTIYYHIAQ